MYPIQTAEIPDPTSYGLDLMNFIHAGWCYKQNTQLPNNIETITRSQQNVSQNKIGKAHDNNYNLFFNCGGVHFGRNEYHHKPTNECYALLHEPDDNVLSHVRLPSLPICLSGNCVIYDEDHGLISLGGYSYFKPYEDGLGIREHRENHLGRHYTDFAYALNMNKRKGNMSWQWNSLPNMKRKRAFSSAIMVKLSDGTKKLIRIGGITCRRTYCPTDDAVGNLFSEIYDFQSNQWQNGAIDSEII